MADEPEHPGRRWGEIPGNLEWRILCLEKDSDTYESRLRNLEGRQDVIETKLDTLINNSEHTKTILDSIKDDRYKNLLGFVVMIAAVIAEHFLR